MPRIRKSIEIDASPENVFGYVTNPVTQPDWISFVREAELTSGDGQTKGTTDRWLFKLGPRTHVSEGLWTDYQPPNTFARKSTTAIDMESRVSLSAADVGTRLEWVIDYKAPMGALGALVDSLFMNRVFQNEVEESLESLKAQLEG